VLILLAVTFTWLMGLMGFARSGIRQHWHVYAVLRDTSAEAVTPALGYAANVITTVTIVFFLLVSFIFWLGGLSERGKTGAHGHAAPVISGGSDSEGASTAPSESLRRSLEARSSLPPPEQDCSENPLPLAGRGRGGGVLNGSPHPGSLRSPTLPVEGEGHERLPLPFSSCVGVPPGDMTDCAGKARARTS
jgi:hypothetical protein